MLARRDNCEFSRKASVAQDAGASALVVYDSMMGDPLEIMRQVDGPKIVIPSIFITSESGEEILELLTHEKQVIAVINATGNVEVSESDWQLTVLWFLFVAFIAVSGPNPHLSFRISVSPFLFIFLVPPPPPPFSLPFFLALFLTVMLCLSDTDVDCRIGMLQRCRLPSLVP